MTAPTRGPIDWARHRATEREQRAAEQPGRHTVDTITSDALDALYEQLDAAQRTSLARQLDTANRAFAAAHLRAARNGAALDRTRRAHASTIIEARRQAARAEQAEAELGEHRNNYLGACTTIAAMHAAAVGRDDLGPTRGVVEDVADVRTAMLQAQLERDTACRSFNAAALSLDDALATIARVRAAIARADWPHAQVPAADIRAALDPQEPTP